MKMTRLFLFSAVAIIATATLAWAGGAKETTATVPANVQWVTPDRIGNPNAPTTLTYSVQLTYSQQANIPSRVEYLTKMSTEWAKTHTDFKLVPQIQGGTAEEIMQKILQQLASGTAPDFAMIDGMFVPLVYNQLASLDSYIGKKELDDYFSWARQTMVDPSNNQLKGLWFTTNAVGLWYRKDLLPNPPKTWAEVIADGQKLKQQGFADGLLTVGYDEQIPYGSVLPMFYGLGGKLVDSSGSPIFGKGQNRQDMIEVLQFWADAVKAGVVPQSVVGIKQPDTETVEAAKPNQVAMFLGGSWLLSSMRNQLKGNLSNWDFTYTPQKDASIYAKPGSEVAGGYNWGFFTKDPKRLKAALDFVQTVYTSESGMSGWCFVSGYTPTRYSVLDSPQFKSDPWQQAFGKVVEVATTRPGVKAYSIISVNLQNAFQAVIIGRETPTQAVDNAYQKTMNQLSS